MQIKENCQNIFTPSSPIQPCCSCFPSHSNTPPPLLSQPLTQHILQLHSVSSKLPDSLWQLVIGHLIFVHLPAEHVLIHSDLFKVQVTSFVLLQVNLHRFRGLWQLLQQGRAATKDLYRWSKSMPCIPSPGYIQVLQFTAVIFCSNSSLLL